MKDKMLNKFSVESNGETVKVNIMQTDKGITVRIDGNTMDVVINNELIYSKYDKPEYKDIPPELRDFVEKHLNAGEDGIEKKSGKVCLSVLINGDDYYVQMPTNRSKCGDVYFHNWLNSIEKIEGYGVKIPDGKANLDKLIKNIESIGYRLVYAWEGNEYEDTFRLIVPISDFNENKLSKCIELWKNYNAYLEKFINMI